jgi:GGDEF domain-containing protein
MRVGSEEILVTISVGVAHWQAGDDALSFAEVYRRANDALRTAKLVGPNQTILFGHQRNERPAKHVGRQHI